MKQKIKHCVTDYQVLLKEVPTIPLVIFILTTILMNLMASKCFFSYGDIVALDSGYLLSWIVFLIMDVITMRFGSKATIKLNILAAIFQLICSGIFALIALLPGNGEDYTAFNSIFGNAWFVVLASIMAFIVSGIVNALLNGLIGKLFKNNPNSKVAYIARSWVSTTVGQFVDNFLFSFITFVIFAPIYWGWGYSVPQAIGSGIVGALFELLLQAIFSPIGIRINKKWKDEGIGEQYLKNKMLIYLDKCYIIQVTLYLLIEER